MLAILSLVFSILWMFWLGSIAAVVLGHLALNQINRNPQQGGRGVAIAGLVIGYLGIALLILGIVAAIATSSGPSSTY